MTIKNREIRYDGNGTVTSNIYFDLNTLEAKSDKADIINQIDAIIDSLDNTIRCCDNIDIHPYDKNRMITAKLILSDILNEMQADKEA